MSKSSKEKMNQTLKNLQVMQNWNNEHLNVLILDDDPSINRIIEHNLIMENQRMVQNFKELPRPLHISCFTNEVEAINAIHNNSYDICIIDVSLQNSNGFTIGRIIRSMNYSEVPIIYISSDSDYLFDYYKIDQGNTYFYPKPLDRDAFQNVFSNMVKL